MLPRQFAYAAGLKIAGFTDDVLRPKGPLLQAHADLGGNAPMLAALRQEAGLDRLGLAQSTADNPRYAGGHLPAHGPVVMIPDPSKFDLNVAALAHEMGHAQNGTGVVPRLSRAFSGARSPAVHALLAGLGAAAGGFSDNDAALYASPLAAAPLIPTLVEEGRASLNANKILKNVVATHGLAGDVMPASRKLLGRGYLSYLLPALGVAGAGLAARTVRNNIE